MHKAIKIGTTCLLAGLASVFSGCDGQEDIADIADGADEAISINLDILAEYEIDGNDVIEYRSIVNPDYVYVAIDGVSATGITSWKQTDITLGAPVLRNKFKSAVGTVYEFVPASNLGILCTYIDGDSAGALTHAVLPDGGNARIAVAPLSEKDVQGAVTKAVSSAEGQPRSSPIQAQPN
jgi:hypothetical protein